MTIGDVETLSGSGESPSLAALRSSAEAAAVPQVVGTAQLYDDDGNYCEFEHLSTGEFRFVRVLTPAQDVFAT